MTGLSLAFIIIITAFGAIYAFFTKQLKIALSLLIMVGAFCLATLNTTKSFGNDLLLAFALVIYIIGMIVLVKLNKKDLNDNEKQTDEDK